MAWPKRLCPPIGAFCAGALSLGLAGCYPWDAEVVGDGHQPGVLMPEPHGAFVHRIQQVQASKAQASNYVFYLDEWYMGGTALGPYGMYHLQHIAPKLANVPYPVVIQPSPDAALNETRRQQIVLGLTKLGLPEAEQRVIIAFPDAEGLFGDEAPRDYLDMIRPHNGIGGYGLYGPFAPYGAYGGFQGLNGFNRSFPLGGFGSGIGLFGY